MSARVIRLLRPTQETTYPEKKYHILRAEAALQGATLDRIEDERGVENFVLSKWHLTRQLPSLDAVETWLERLGGRI